MIIRRKNVQNVYNKRRKKQGSVKKGMDEVTTIKYVRKSEKKNSILGKHVLSFRESFLYFHLLHQATAEKSKLEDSEKHA